MAKLIRFYLSLLMFITSCTSVKQTSNFESESQRKPTAASANDAELTQNLNCNNFVSSKTVSMHLRATVRPNIILQKKMKLWEWL